MSLHKFEEEWQPILEEEQYNKPYQYWYRNWICILMDTYSWAPFNNKIQKLTKKWKCIADDL